jgi:asparagine synthase (glutamine-hydrolysing)
VVLTGDGGDEVFAGYGRHARYAPSVRLLRWLPERLWRPTGRLGLRLVPEALSSRLELAARARTAARALLRDEAALYVPRLFRQPPHAALAMLPAPLRSAVDTHRYVERVRGLFRRLPPADPIARMLAVDLQTSLGDEMLAKLDRMSMAHGLEARVPLLDHELVEAALAMPDVLKRDGATGKLPLRRLAEARLGASVARRPKSGFNSPLQPWLSAEPATRLQFESLLPAPALLDPEVTASFGRRSAWDAGSASIAFAALVLETWANQRGVRAD